MIEVNSLSGCVSFNEKIIARLGANEIKIIVFLARNVNQLSLKDDLLDCAWDGRVVSPNSLTVAIKKIRDVLAETDVYIETIHRRGYILHGDPNLIKVIDENNKFIANLNEDSKDNSLDVIVNPVKNHRGMVKKITLIIFCCFYLLTVSFLTLSIYNAEKSFFCYELQDGVIVCGVYPLTDEDKTYLKKLNIKKGLSFYVNNNSLEGIEVHYISSSARY